MSQGRHLGRKIAIVLADGVWSHKETAVKAAQVCHRKEISVIGIGFGSADKKFLQDISCGDIDSMFVEQSELVSSFGKIAQEIGQGAAGAASGRTGAEMAAETWEAPGERKAG